MKERSFNNFREFLNSVMFGLIFHKIRIKSTRGNISGGSRTKIRGVLSVLFQLFKGYFPCSTQEKGTKLILEQDLARLTMSLFKTYFSF